MTPPKAVHHRTRPWRAAALLRLRGVPFLVLLAAGHAMGEPALPTLETRAQATVVDGSVYFRPGRLFIGRPHQPGRPGLAPLESDDPIMLPSSLSSFEPLSDRCRASSSEDIPLASSTPEAAAEARRTPTSSPAMPTHVLTRGDLGGDGQMETVYFGFDPPHGEPTLVVTRSDTPLSRGRLPLSARPCAALVAELQEDAPPELLVVWTSQGPQGLTVGLHVFRLPDRTP